MAGERSSAPERIGSRFVAPSVASLQRAQQELEAAIEAHRTLDDRLRAAIQSGDVAAAAAMTAEFGSINDRIETARAACLAAESEDDRRRAAIEAKEAKARHRAATAHAAAFTRAARELAGGVQTIKLTHRDAMNALESVHAISPDVRLPLGAWTDWPRAIEAAVDAVVGGRTEFAGDLPNLIAKVQAALAAAIADMEKNLPTDPETEEAA